MINLLKYEFRKTQFSKLILLVLGIIAEIVFLIGIWKDNEITISIGISSLTLVASFGILYIGLESILVLHRELNSKQSYMLFMTPKNNYQILGAKLLENAFSILLTGVCFVLLAAADIMILLRTYSSIGDFYNVLKSMLESFDVYITIDVPTLLSLLLLILCVWFSTVIAADFAVVLSATIFNGKKFSGIISFALFLAINWVFNQILDRVSTFFSSDIQNFLGASGVMLVLGILTYLGAGYLMNRKLSV